MARLACAAAKCHVSQVTWHRASMENGAVDFIWCFLAAQEKPDSDCSAAQKTGALFASDSGRSTRDTFVYASQSRCQVGDKIDKNEAEVQVKKGKTSSR
eukprot:905430-Amphidinium_carterae.1